MKRESTEDDEPTGLEEGHRSLESMLKTLEPFLPPPGEAATEPAREWRLTETEASPPGLRVASYRPY
jgi:hypothetical protein